MMPRSPFYPLYALSGAMILAAVPTWPAVAQDRASANPPSLASVYERAIRDTNGDGLGDEIAARVIVPARASIQEVQAAANIAARLGYETTAASLPIALTDDRVSSISSIALPILVGRENKFVRELIGQGRLALDSLAPGQGLVALVASAAGEQPSLVVVGADDAGTLSASVQVAARLPRLWNATGVTLAEVERQARYYLRKRNVDALQAAATTIVVDDARRGILSVKLQVLVPEVAGQHAVQAFEALDRAHRFGRDIDILDFSPAASTIVEVRTRRATSGQVAIRRTGPNWRALAALPPDPPPLSRDALVGAAKKSKQPSAGRSISCVGCPAFLVDGMIMGGGGATYGTFSPKDPVRIKAFDLAELYTINGWFADRYRDLTPDATETSLIVGGHPQEALGAAHIAARLGLETTGITLPIARRDSEVTRPGKEPSPILVGRDNVLVQALVEAGKLRIDELTAGEGVLQIVPRAFGTTTATVVAGADEAGARAASLHLARRLPYLWETRPGSPTLQDLKTQVVDFFEARTAAGQAAQAADELAVILEEATAGGAALDAVDVRLVLAQVSELLERHLKRQIERQTGSRSSSVEVQAISVPMSMAEDRVALPWEGDAFWSRLRSDVLPRIEAGDIVTIEARLSEDPSVRAAMARKARALLQKAGVVNPRVEIRSAYKQGFFWLVEEVLPELQSKQIRSVHIKVRAEQPDYSRDFQTYEHPARWIKALYPADEIFERDLGLPMDAFVIEQVDRQENIYSLEATGADGAIVYTSRFDPSIVERAVLDASPEKARVQVETGRFSATVNGRSVAHERIETDLERVWTVYQQTILPKLRESMLRASNDTSAAGQVPLFRDLRIDALLSEPDYGIGIAGEHISSVEGLSQDLARITNAWLRASGSPTVARVIPLILAKPGRASQLDVTLTKSPAASARMEVSYRRRGDQDAVRIVRDLTAVGVDGPQLTRIVARSDALGEIRLQMAVPNEQALARATKAIDSLRRLQGAGLFRSDLSYDHVDALTIDIRSPELQQVTTLPHTGTSSPGNVHLARQRPSGPLVSWDHVIDSPESERIIEQLSFYPSVASYRKARSFEGRDISVLEITAPAAGALVSVAKIAAYKPTALIVGRQHGNEPSSTSFILRLAEALASDPGFEDLVRKVNVVLLPIMNPDGAALAADIRKHRPLDVASPGYLSAIGQDVTISTVLPESVVDPYLWRRWLPDIYLNAHGATSHEVVQTFNGYVSSQAPTYSFRRGWYSLAFRVPRDPRYGAWEQAALALREAMADGIGADTIARAGNLEDSSRFARWGHRFAPHLEPLELYEGTMLFYTDRDSGELLGLRRLPNPPADTADANHDARIGEWPMVTLDAGTFEAADEGAQGPLLDLAARTGFAAALSQLEYLRDGTYEVQRIVEEAPEDGTTLTTIRVRPVMPPASTGDRRDEES